MSPVKYIVLFAVCKKTSATGYTLKTSIDFYELITCMKSVPTILQKESHPYGSFYGKHTSVIKPFVFIFLYRTQHLIVDVISIPAYSQGVQIAKENHFGITIGWTGHSDWGMDGS